MAPVRSNHTIFKDILDTKNPGQQKKLGKSKTKEGL